MVLFLLDILRSGITESYGSSSFNFLRILHTVVTVLVYIPINSAQRFCFLYIFISISFLFLFLFFLVISLMVGDVEHLFVYTLTICISSLEKCLFSSFAYF